MIAREKKFVWKGVQHTVKFPSVGQIIDIESLKQALTTNRYGAMATSLVKSMTTALDLVDAIAFFQVMCPVVGASLPASYTEISDPKLAFEISSTYRKDIAPWFNEIMNELNGITREVAEEDADKDDRGNK